MKRLSNNHAMTLMELTVVLIIVGVMATFAIPRLAFQVDRMRNQEASAFLFQIYGEQKDFARDQPAGSYATTLGALGMDVPILKHFDGIVLFDASAECGTNPDLILASMTSQTGPYKLHISVDGVILCEDAVDGCTMGMCLGMGFR